MAGENKNPIGGLNPVPIIGLKALAYDYFVAINDLSLRLNAVNKEIQSRQIKSSPITIFFSKN